MHAGKYGASSTPGILFLLLFLLFLIVFLLLLYEKQGGNKDAGLLNWEDSLATFFPRREYKDPTGARQDRQKSK